MRKLLISFVVIAMVLLGFQAVEASAATVGTTTGYVHFRTAASTSSKVISSIPTDKKVTIIDEVNKYWVKVEYAGKTGYISTHYVNYTAPKPVYSKADKVINLAKSYQGKVTYVFGKNSPSTLTFDCSSFTRFIFGKEGVSLRWGSRVQATQGKYVSKGNLQKGDLVFFTVGTSKSIGHVGIYVGNGKFINNLPHKGVVISDMSGYWNSHYVTARRVL